MADETEFLRSVPFTRAEVRIYSVNWDKTFTRTLEKPPRPRKRSKDLPASDAHNAEIVRVLSTQESDEMAWKCSPGSPREAEHTRWQHKYLPTSRLHISDDPLAFATDLSRGFQTQLTEEQLDTVFARSVEQLWNRYSSQVLGDVRLAQEQGLASILRAVLSPPSEHDVRSAQRLDAETAYRRVRSFLKRQGSAAILGKKAEFEARYSGDQTLQDVVRDIDAVEDKINDAMAARTALQDLISRMFTDNKEVSFTDDSIAVKSYSGESLDLASLSSGEKHLLRIFVETLLVQQSTLLVDEPEISMHVDWQERLIEALRTLNPHAQLVLATHSPEVMAHVSDDKIFTL